VRAALAAILSPVLGYWLPTRAFSTILEGGSLGGALFSLLFFVAAMILGAYVAVVAAMRMRRTSGVPSPVAPIEELLVALLGVVAQSAPLWFGFTPGDGAAQPLAIQATTVFLAILVLGGSAGSHRWLPPIMVGNIRPSRELAVRAMVAGLMPAAILYAILPTVAAGSALEMLVTGEEVDLGRRILIAWTGATLAGVSVGMRAWRRDRPALLDKPEQVVITVAAMGLAAGVWYLFGGLEGPAAAFLVHPAAIFVATVVLSTRRERADAAFFGTPSPALGIDEPLLVPPGAGIGIGHTETAHEDPATGRREIRIEARWLVPRAFGLVTSEYLGRNGLVLQRESATEMLLTRPGRSPAAVRIVAQPPRPVAPDLPPPAPRTEVRVRVAHPG
jgi:hypothetical protein